MPIEVAEKAQKWFETQKFEFRLYPAQSVKKFQSLSQLYDFLVAEEAFWKPVDERVSRNFQQINESSVVIELNSMKELSTLLS